MKTYLICYDINNPDKDYSRLLSEIKLLFSICWHHLDLTWIVKSKFTTTDLTKHLENFINEGDGLLIINITGRATAWTGFDEEASEWLEDNL